MSCRSQRSSPRARPSACVRSALEITLFLVSVSWVKFGVDSRCHVYGVRQDVLTQRTSPCVLCLGTPPACIAGPASPSVPTGGLAGSARMATVCPLGGAPALAWCSVYLPSPYSRPGEGVPLTAVGTGSQEGEAALLGPRVHRAGRGPGWWQGLVEWPL